jgi:hypothetical protein
MMDTLVFGISIAIGLALPLLVYAGYRTAYLTETQVLLFGIGFVLGTVWEAGLVMVLPRFVEASLYSGGVKEPVHPVLHVISYSLWDGLLFLVGVLLVVRLLDGPHFRTVRWQELGLLVAWGQLQSFAVELTAIITGAWAYHPQPFNPALFWVGSDAITLLPQAIWLVAMLVFYGCCLAVYRREEDAESV